MDDSADDLLAALGRVARETDDAPDAWIEHAAGTLDPKGRMALRAAGADDPQARAALALIEPPAPGFDDALTDRLLSEVAPAAAPGDGPAERRGRSWGALAGGLVLLAAAVVLGIGLTRPDTLPTYQFDLKAGERAVRGADPGARRAVLFPDSRIALTVRPAEAVEGPVTVGAFVRQGEEITRFTPAVACAATGACKVEGLVGPLLGGRTGEATLIFVVARPDALPTADALSDFEPRFERAVDLRAE